MKNCVYLPHPDQSKAELMFTNSLLHSCLGGASYLSNKYFPHPAHFATHRFVLIIQTQAKWKPHVKHHQHKGT